MVGITISENSRHINAMDVYSWTCKEEQWEENDGVMGTTTNEIAERVFLFWKEIMNKPRAIFDDKRRRAITARLKEGFTEEELRRAILGCSKSRFHMGENEGGKVYNDITLICRNASKVEQFIEILGEKQVSISTHKEIKSCENEQEESISLDDLPKCYICGDRLTAVYKIHNRLIEKPCHRCKPMEHYSVTGQGVELA